MYRRLVAFALAVAAIAVVTMLVPLTAATRANVRTENLSQVADRARQVADRWEQAAGSDGPAGTAEPGEGSEAASYPTADEPPGEGRLEVAAAAVQSIAVPAELVAGSDEDDHADLAKLADELARQLGSPDSVTLIPPDGQPVGPPVPEQADELVAQAAMGESGTLDTGTDGFATAPAFLTDEAMGVVLVTATSAELSQGLAERMAGVGLLALALLFAAGTAGWLLARRTVAPIRAVARTAERIAAGDLAARADPSQIKEVAEVGLALNRMAERTGELIADERVAAAELAHQLRTPLTVLTADIDAVGDPGLRAKLAADAQELTRTADEIINSARRVGREGLHATCDAAAVVGQRVDFWRVLADFQGRELSSSIVAGPLPVRLTEYDLTTALDILLQNVFVHTPEGCGFSVDARPGDAGAVRVTVTDEGPGFAEVPASQAGSTNLGLAIAERLAQACGGRLERGPGPAGTGASVVLVLGPPAS